MKSDDTRARDKHLNEMVTLVGRGGQSRKVRRRLVEHLIANELANWSNSAQTLAHVDIGYTIRDAIRGSGSMKALEDSE